MLVENKYLYRCFKQLTQPETPMDTSLYTFTSKVDNYSLNPLGYFMYLNIVLLLVLPGS